MSVSVRAAHFDDIDTVADLLMADARQRQAIDPVFWKVKQAGRDEVFSAIKTWMEKDERPFHQALLLAEADGKAVGMAHTLVLPVPPVYAGGKFGPPGLVMEDCYATEDAPAGACQALIEAAEADLVEAGAEELLGQSASGRSLEQEYLKRGYEPLTLYLAKTGLRQAEDFPAIRSATEDDVDDIVSASTVRRQILYDLNAFWKPATDANTHFDTWMRKSLTLSDRDMFVCGSDGEFHGYAISQPATTLHFPIAHDIAAVGVIDDYHHVDLLDTAVLPEGAGGGADLLHVAEAALEARGYEAAFVVCPAAWTSKIELLEAAGYSTAITWFKKKRQAP